MFFIFANLDILFIFAQTSILQAYLNNLIMTSIEIPKNPNFHWLPKHLQHITENIVFKNRNISFLAINALFKQTKTHTILPSDFGNDHYLVEDFVDLQTNDRIRTKAERLIVVFTLDRHHNIIIKTAYSENDSSY